jgi:hypothetical protein
MRIIYYSLSLLFIFLKLQAQELAIGDWNVHTPYRNAISVAESDQKIYCASESSLFSYNLDDNAVETLSKASGLSDAGINTIAYSKEYETLIIAYSNGNIDLIQGGQIINLSDIKRKSMIGTKSINHIFFMESQAWLACSFGIVILDITSKNFLGNWIIGPNGTNIEVKDLTFDGQYIYASTADGVYRADINSPNIQDYNYWSQMEGLPSGNYNLIAYFMGKVFTNYSASSGSESDTLYEFDGSQWEYATSLAEIDSSVNYRRYSMRETNNMLIIGGYNNNAKAYDTTGNIIQSTSNYGSSKDVRDALYGKDGNLWIADHGFGLVRSGSSGGYDVISPSGPVSSNVFDICIDQDMLWIAPGGVAANFSLNYIKEGISYYNDGSWSYLSSAQISAFDTLPDLLSVAIHPDDPAHVFIGSSIDGVLEFNNYALDTIYTHYNSTLSYPGGTSFVRVETTDIEFDSDKNLWVTNIGVANPLSVKLSSDEWKSFDCGGLVSSSKRFTNLIIDPYNQKWVTINEGGILVFDEKETYDDDSDDLAQVLNTTVGNGGLHTNSVTCLALDLDSAIWIGTNEGPCVISYPQGVFTADDFDSNRPQVYYDGHPEYLLQNENITDIAVDGANRKWLATETSGVYLVSEDGSEQIAHFDEDNSPLLSNNVRTIAINQANGEIFFGTDKGIVSYKGTATEGAESYDEILIYPNPVRKNFGGTIAINGLMANSSVHITDIAGNLVYKTIAEGGQANWDGKNFKEEEVCNGIYLVFCSSENGGESVIGKIAIAR